MKKKILHKKAKISLFSTSNRSFVKDLVIKDTQYLPGCLRYEDRGELDMREVPSLPFVAPLEASDWPKSHHTGL